MNGIRFTPTMLAAACATMLSACGSGNDGQAHAASTSQPQPATQTISGKAIDGYLAGALVCLDLNTNGVCDTGEPSATTDANGNFAIAYDGDATGQRLLAQVSASTRDLSRPQGFQFPASFTLSAVASGTANQHVTPLTAMVAAQMEAGMSQAEAIAAVQKLLGAQIDPASDYVANGDVTTLAKASQIVDKITSLAATGNVDAAAARNTLNAIIAKGDVVSVTQTDVDAQAAKPVYTLADASQVLASPLYSFVDAYMTTLDGPTQAIQQIVSAKLQTTYQSRQVGGTIWTDLPRDKATSYLESRAQFVLKSDGTWTDMLTPADWRAPVTLTSIGKTLKGNDPATGIGVTFEERRVDLSNQPATLGVSGTLFGPDVSVYPALASPFPSRTSGYLGIKSFAEDYVVLPLGLGNPFCEFPYSKGGACAATYATRPNLPPYDPSRPPYNPNVPQNDAKLPSPLTSVQQLVGLSIVDSQILQATAEILPSGQARITVEFDPRTPDDDVIFNATWSIYARNPNVMVFDMARADAQTLASTGAPVPLTQGAKFVLAVRNGQLHGGLLFPAGYGQRTIQFANALPSVLTTPIARPPLLSTQRMSAN